MLLPAGYNQLLVEVSNGQSVEGLQHIHPVGVFGGGGYFIVAPRGPRTPSRGPRTPVAWWRSLWSLEENTLKAACILCYRHVPCAPLTAGLIVCVANLMSDHAMARRLNEGRRV